MIQRLAETYGPASVLRTILGVSFFGQLISLCSSHINRTFFCQRRLLHVYDPRALHHILIKDAEHFPKDTAPSKYAWANPDLCCQPV